MDRVAIYLAGKIKKTHEVSDEAYWSDEDLQILQREFAPYHTALLNPAVRQDDLSDQKSVFGRDLTQVFSCDVVFCDARDRRGLGVGAEMMWAKLHRIPVLTLAPMGSHYRKSSTTLLDKFFVTNWCHPFVENLSDAIVESIAEGVEWIKQHVMKGKSEFKGIDSLYETMEY